MQKTILSILLMLTFSNVIKTECLAQAALQSVGLTDALEAPVENTSTVCTSYTQVCVDPEKLQENIKSVLTGFRDGIRSTFGSTKNILSKINQGVFKMKTKYEDESKTAKVEEKLGDNLDMFKEILKSCNETECDIFGETLDTADLHKVCFKGIADLIAKVLCLSLIHI